MVAIWSVVQPGLEPAGDALTSTIAWRWNSDDRSRTTFAQVKVMIRKEVDLVHHNKSLPENNP
ncbi:hypothetical protein CcI6DRAFT_04840 [Frankia sp. CcI6]|nr:hypothetical protein CcI6DRAFT_04840 [Frankia sp. CcI6]KDA40542.1 hypothetical protein BMG523Draft_04650 [Frankia sp. BMG5.23]